MKKETVIYTLYYSYQSGDTQFDRKYKEFSSQFIDEIKQIAKVESHRKDFRFSVEKKTIITEKAYLSFYKRKTHYLKKKWANQLKEKLRTLITYKRLQSY